MAQQHLRPKPESCRGCPAYESGKSFVPAVSPKAPRLALLDQGPGEDEAYFGVPFVGASGKELDKWLFKAKIDRAACWIGNVVQCWLPGNRAPTSAEVAHCSSTYWLPSLRSHPSLRVVVGVGAPASRYLGGIAPGRVQEIDL